MKSPSLLTRSFYDRPVLTVARDLLGCLLVRHIRGVTTMGRIVEVEAYREDDPASHSYKGQTARNEVMFGRPGHLYVYFTYGMHFCGNVVTGAVGRGEAVLLRAVEPIIGLEHMARRRYGIRRIRNRTHLRDLARGPARLCQAFSLTKTDNGADLTSDRIHILRENRPTPVHAVRTPRIGIRQGKEKKWRFCMKDNPWVSGPPSFRG